MNSDGENPPGGGFFYNNCILPILKSLMTQVREQHLIEEFFNYPGFS